MALKAKIDYDIAPKIAVEALGEALMQGSAKFGVSQDQMNEMKKKLT